MIIPKMALLCAHFASRVFSATDTVHFPSIVIKAQRQQDRVKRSYKDIRRVERIEYTVALKYETLFFNHYEQLERI